MSKEKQMIEELADFLWRNTLIHTEDLCHDVAETIITADYRKQSEPISCGHEKGGGWISVSERLPERNGRYLTHCKIEGQSLVCILYYCNVGDFNEGTVTHWMPIPEPPKGDYDGKK